MARNVYSLRIFASGSLAPGAGLVGPIVPDQYLYVLRDIDVTLRTAAPATLAIYSPIVNAFLCYVPDSALDSSSSFRWRGRQVYGPGERVGFQALSGSWDVMASGYQLTLP